MFSYDIEAFRAPRKKKIFRYLPFYFAAEQPPPLRETSFRIPSVFAFVAETLADRSSADLHETEKKIGCTPVCGYR